jgi:hypothetical protein
LVIALGIAGEVLASAIAHTCQEELTRRSNDRLAEALKEVTYLRSSRRKVLAGSEARFITAIRPFSGTKFDVGLAPAGFREAWDFNWDIEPLLIQAGWTFMDWLNAAGVTHMKRNNWTPAPALRGYGIVNALNVTIELHPSHRAALLPVAEGLADALTDIGITASIEENIIATTSVNEDAIHFLIGMKT